jgi:putative DNA primase/helicase
MARAPTSKAPRVITPELIRQALGCIPPDVDRETWVRLGMAVKAELGAEGFELWDAWSSDAQGYSATDARDTWRSIKAGGRVTVGTLFGIAKEHGFRFPDSEESAMTPTERAELERQAAEDAQRRAAVRAAEEARYRDRADRARRDAAELWAEGLEIAPGAAAEASPYLARKGVQAHRVRRLADGTLLVPVRDLAGELHNLQRIAPAKPTPEQEARGLREKLFLPGGRKSGLLHWLGDPQQLALDPAAPQVLCLAEGYATAASIHEATGRPVAVCFDAGNLVTVAKLLRPAFPGAWLLVCGDDDRATAERTGKNPGREKAEAAARAARTVDAPALAIFPEGLAELDPHGSDFNDLASAAGLDAVARLVDAGIAALGEPVQPKPRQGRKPARGSANAAGEGQDTAEASGAPADGRAPGPADADADACTEPAPGVPGGRDPFRLDEFVAADVNPLLFAGEVSDLVAVVDLR